MYAEHEEAAAIDSQPADQGIEEMSLEREAAAPEVQPKQAIAVHPLAASFPLLD